MGNDFFKTSTSVEYDGYVRATFGGVGIVPIEDEDENITRYFPRTLSENITEDAPDISRHFISSHGAVPVVPAGNSAEPVFDYGALRASLYAYNSSADSANSRTAFREALATQRDQDDLADELGSQVTARVLGHGDEAGTFYVRGPYWWAYKRSNILPQTQGFGVARMTEMDYRDPRSATAREKERQIQIVKDGEDFTLANLIKLMADNTTVFGQNTVELRQIFGAEGLGRYDALYEKLTAAEYLTDEFDADTLVPWAGESPSIDSYVDLALTKTLSSPGEVNASNPSLDQTNAPTPVSPGTASATNAAAASASAAGMGAISAPSAIVAQAVTAADAPDFSTDVDVFAGPIAKEDLVPTAAILSDTNIGITEPEAITVQAITEEQLTTLEELFRITADPTLTTITVAPPEKQTMTADITAAVAAFTAQLNLRFAEEEARLRASLATSRMVMTSHWDNALAILEANKQAQINEYDKSLRVEQAKQNLQAAVTHEELLLRCATVKAEVQRYILDRYARITANELQAAQQVSSVYLQAYQMNSESLLRAAIATTENAIRARVAHAENYLRFESAKAEQETQVSIATAENYTRAALQSATNLLQRATAQYENLVRLILADADAGNKVALSNSDVATRASISNAENVVRAAIALCDNATKVSISNADSATRVSMSNADAATRVALANAESATQAAISNAESVLRHTLARLDADARMKIANQEASLQASTTTKELALKKELAEIDTEMKLKSLNWENRFKVANTNNEMSVRIKQMLFEGKARIIEANNSRMLAEIAARVNMARMVSDVTLAWMGAMTSNANALSNVISTSLQQYVHQINTQREFDMNVENQRWQIAVQRGSMMNSLAELKWRAQCQNLLVMQQTMASLGQATGTVNNPSTWDNILQGVSVGASAISTIISTVTALS